MSETINQTANNRFKVANVSEISENTMQAFDINGEDILIVHQGGVFYAMPNECTHQDYPLDDGELLQGKVKCMYHGATFDLETGTASLPAMKKICHYATTVKDGVLYIDL